MTPSNCSQDEFAPRNGLLALLRGHKQLKSPCIPLSAEILMPEKKSEPPKKTKGDYAHAAVKAGLAAIPVGGGAGAEIFQAILQPPLEKRRDEWFEELAQRLEQLEIGLQELQENDEFISASMYAYQLALRTHEKEKLDALRNAVINVARQQAPESTLQHMFLNFVDSLTPLHLQILKFFQAPIVPDGMSMGGLSNLIEREFPELRGQRELYDQLGKDLFSRGLLNAESFHVTISESGLRQKRTTNLGDGFLRFIEESE